MRPRLQVLGKTGTTVATARIDEVIAETWIAADGLANMFVIGTQQLGQVGDLVQEAGKTQPPDAALAVTMV